MIGVIVELRVSESGSGVGGGSCRTSFWRSCLSIRSRAGRKSKGKRKWRVRRADLARGADDAGRDVSEFEGLVGSLEVDVVAELT